MNSPRDSIEDLYPLSPMQQGILFHALLDEDRAIYFEQFSCTVSGPLDVAAFKAAWQRVIERHTILRTAFVWEDLKEPMQFVEREVRLHCVEQDWRGVPAAEQAERLQEYLRQDREKGTDLTKAPLMRLSLLRTAEQVYHFVWSHHHLLLDGWSGALLFQEILVIYRALSRGERPHLEPSRPYGDYIEWLQKQDPSDAESFWRRTLKGFTSPTPLGLDRVSNAKLKQARRHERQEWTLPPDLATALGTLARQQQLTLNTLLQGAWALLLSRYSGQELVVFGATVSGRPAALPGVESILGNFINTLPVCVRVSGDAPLRSWLKELQDAQAEMRQYEYSSLVQIQGWSEVPRGLPFFESLIVFENYPTESAFSAATWEEQSRLSLSDIRTDDLINFPLAIGAEPVAESGLKLRMVYDPRRFDDATIARMMGHFQTALETFVVNFNQPLKSLTFLTEAERRQLLLDWNDTRREYPADTSVVELIREQAQRTPHHIALSFHDRSLTYSELDALTNRLAHRLQRLGVGPDTLVGLFLERSLEMVIAILGVLKAGGAYLPFDTHTPHERLAGMLAETRPRVLLTQRWLAAQLPAVGAEVVTLDDGEEWLVRESAAAPVVAVRGDHLAYVIYTSGSTGRPKGVMSTHAGLLNRLLWMQEALPLRPADRVLQKTPYSFDVSVWEFLWPLLVGARLVVAPPEVHKDSTALVQLMTEEQITVVHFVPSMLRAVLEAEGWEGCRSLRQVICSGEALTLELARRFHERSRAELHNLYGPTEAAIDVTHWRCERGDSRESVPIGRPIANTRLYVLDGAGRPVPVGVRGELHIGGVNVARGYVGQGGQTAEKFIPEEFSGVPGARLYRTGDIARYRSDGSIEYVGRADGQVKIRGFRIEVGEIENALTEHEAVGEAVVVAREDTPGDKRLVAYIVYKSESPLTTEQLRGFLKRQLPDYMLPSAFVSLDAIPLTPSGKTDRRSLPAPQSSRPQLAKTFVAPSSPSEKLLAGVWARVLGLEPIGVHDNFFDLGGDSIRSIEVCALARKDGLCITVQQFFQYQTIYELARVAERLENSLPAAPATAPFSLVSESDRLRLPEDVEDAYPLTRLQAGMLFHSEYTDGAATYHNLFSYHLKGPFDIETLQRAIDDLVNQHPVLRTSFDLSAYSEPLQLVHKEVAAPIAVDDLRHLTAAAQEGFINDGIDADMRTRFNWKSAPLLRFHVYRRSDETYQFVVSFHHAILDGWSNASLNTNLFNHYLSLLKGAANNPPPQLATTFRDYVGLELEALASEECRSYWTQKLSESTITKLPRWPAARRVPDDGPQVRSLTVPLSVEDCQDLRRLAQAEGVTLKSVLFAAHLRVLSFLNAQPDVITGLLSNGRPEALDGERIYGLFLNTLPFRLKLAGGTWSNLIREAFEAEQEALPYRRFPLAEIQRLAGNGQSLFDTCFNFTHYHVYQGIQETGEIQMLDTSATAETNFPLLTNFSVDAVSSVIRLGLDYDSAELCDEQVEAIGSYYVATLKAMVSDPQARYELQCPLSAAERRRLLVEWNETRMPYPQGQGLHEQFEAHAGLAPDSLALTFRDARWTYAELNKRANQLAHYLRDLGVGPETHVGVCMERTPRMIVGILGALKAGAAYLPLDPAYPKERLSFMLDDSRAAVLLTERHLLEHLPTHEAHVVCLDTADAALAGQSEENPAVVAKPDNLAYLIYTSGSTGKPKGVAIQHRSAVAFLSWARTFFSAQQLAGVLFSTSICFDLSIFELFAPLSVGGKVILCENALQLPSSRQADGLTLINLVPSALAELLRADSIPTSVRTINLAGEPLDLTLVKEAYAKTHVERVFNLYGPSEDTTYSTGILLDRESNDPPPIGRPVANTQVYLLDQHLQPVPVAAPGHLYLGGDGLARGYLNESQLTAQKFIPDPFAIEPGRRLYQTGDLARYLPDGNLEFLGRADHQVKIRGFRIELGEIEAVLKQHPAIENAAVLALDDGAGEKRLAAYVVMEDREQATIYDLHAFLKEKLPGHMIPTAFVPMERLPLTPNGKLNRAALPAPERNVVELADAAILPRDTLELKLMQIWEEVLGVRPIGIRDNFFLDLGGHSILAVRLIALVEKQLGRRLSLATFLRGATIEQLALALRRDGEEVSWTPLVLINPNGSRPPFFCVHPATGGALCYVHLARHLGRDQPFYGLQAPGLDGAESPLASIEDLAVCYTAALQAVQPEGPYFLGGHSFGGIVAFEMARQLRRAGHEVALLAILDTMAPAQRPESFTDLEQGDDTQWLCEIVRVIERFLNKKLDIEYQELKTLSHEEQLSLVYSRLQEIHIFPQDAGIDQIRGLLQVEKANVQALQRYVPQVYQGKITLFRAAMLQHEDFSGLPLQRYLDPSLGWEALSSEPVEMHVVAGDHITMITETNVSVLARLLRTHFEG